MAANYAERITAAGRRIARFIAADEAMQKMTRREIKRTLDSAYRDISSIFDSVDLAQASSAVIARHGSPDGTPMTSGEFEKIMQDYAKGDCG